MLGRERTSSAEKQGTQWALSSLRSRAMELQETRFSAVTPPLQPHARWLAWWRASCAMCQGMFEQRPPGHQGCDAESVGTDPRTQFQTAPAHLKRPSTAFEASTALPSSAATFLALGSLLRVRLCRNGQISIRTKKC